jgi:hypothetical protein
MTTPCRSAVLAAWVFLEPPECQLSLPKAGPVGHDDLGLRKVISLADDLVYPLTTDAQSLADLTSSNQVEGHVRNLSI